MITVLILYGGNSPEHEVSIKSAKSILDNIDKNKFLVNSAYITKENEWINQESKSKITNIIEYLKTFDIIFPLTHGVNGEDGKLQGMLDLFNIKYVGSKTLASAITMDKTISKIIFDKYKIPNVPYTIINKNKFKIYEIEKLNYPLIVKPANGGSSLGINKVKNRKELISAIKNAGLYDEKILIEKFINAIELECAVLEDKKIIASTVGEIKPTNEFYDYEAKYIKSSKTLIPANISNKLSKQIKKIATKTFKVMELKSYARIDFLYDIDNKILYLNEINTLPGFTNISMYPKLFEYDKISFKNLISTLILNKAKK